MTDRAGEVARQIEQAQGLGINPDPCDIPMMTVRYICGVYNGLDLRKAIQQSAHENRRQ